ncbi:SDR family oxidoreductase [Desulfotignum phosphitoxidans]|uniref:Putative nucleoside-diphosphate-sugar epimerase n=1 Tax=Desulfotignum phosphitoxidans DSM 13687 TaxID=1286635 RepID=S0G0Y3_9BACT|nr:SDR family oxidoreductase [Desulfotignum phosphitoxidans]EMS77331.1 putative nucleoside-diphosphate-sugar epimerase [Desulfotignum phosphitoxidans DSM 13687]
MHEKTTRPVLVTGATGYVAGRLIPLLLSSGYRVRAMGRSIEKMAARPWGTVPGIELVTGDIMDTASLDNAVAGCGTIYYLVHSMISRKAGYRDADKTGAANMVKAAANQGADHIIYLGGLGDIHHQNISPHLISRNEVGKILQTGPVPATVLRAAMILGSGSASFEILRYLAERLPVMITPKWVSMPTQPIAITNVLEYLKGCLEHPETRGKTFDIGGPDIVSYRDLFAIFAKQAGLPKPMMIPVPVLTPRLSSLWIHLVTPVPAAIARPLAEGLSLPTVCTEHRIRDIIPQDLLTCGQAIERALDRVRQEQVDTCWADAGDLIYPEWAHCGDSGYSGGTILKCGYRAMVQGSASDLWPAVEQVGGETGYYAADLLWKLRGVMDVFSGGVGLQRGRRSRHNLRVGDALDFWRVLEMNAPHRLLLVAEMKLPGQALLEIKITPAGENRCELILLSRFLPKGIWGMAYWYALYPFHQYVFSRMLTGMAKAAGKSLLTPPRRFTPKITNACSLPGE